MKVTRLAILAAAACAMSAGDAWGQQSTSKATLRQARFSSNYYLQEGGEETQQSPSDLAPPAPPSADHACGCEADCCCACDDCCGPWRLFPELPAGFTLTGWIAAGGTVNADNPPSNFNGVTTFNDREEVQLNQLYAALERAMDTGGCGWDWGARLDLLYGTDYIFTQATGLETRRDGSPKWNSSRFYGLAMPQAYVDIGYNDLSLRLGHFYTIMGYEVVTAPQNFFYSHAYTMQYGEPFTHTGGLLTWNYSDQLDLIGGIVNGWDRWDGLNDRAAFLGGAIYTPCHEQYSIAFTVIAGDEANDIDVQTSRFLYSLVFTWNINCRWQYVLQHDNGWQDTYFAVAGAPLAVLDAEWYGINQYLFYTINDCWKAGARFEWFRDDDGVRVAGVRAGNPNAGPYVGDFYEVTLGLNWTPHENIAVRPEVRWDWFEGAGLPFDDGTKIDQFTAALDVILTF